MCAVLKTGRRTIETVIKSRKSLLCNLGLKAMMKDFEPSHVAVLHRVFIQERIYQGCHLAQIFWHHFVFNKMILYCLQNFQESQNLSLTGREFQHGVMLCLYVIMFQCNLMTFWFRVIIFHCVVLINCDEFALHDRCHLTDKGIASTKC